MRNYLKTIRNLFRFFEMVDSPIKGHSAIRITRGKYKGVEYLYRTVKPIEEEGKLTIDYEFYVFKQPPGLKLDAAETDFQQLTSAILHDIITKKRARPVG